VKTDKRNRKKYAQNRISVEKKERKIPLPYAEE
jgi:hypothetical protein